MGIFPVEFPTTTADSFESFRVLHYLAFIKKPTVFFKFPATFFSIQQPGLSKPVKLLFLTALYLSGMYLLRIRYQCLYLKYLASFRANHVYHSR